MNSLKLQDTKLTYKTTVFLYTSNELYNKEEIIITFVISKNKVLRNKHKQGVKDIVVQSLWQVIWRFLKNEK